VTLHASPELGTVGEDVDDLRTYLHRLQGCPPIEHTQLLRCSRHPAGEDAVWFYVEADSEQGVARRRCVACGDVVHLLDSAREWTHPPMHFCPSCSTSIMELAVGLHMDEGDGDGLDRRVQWLALAARCVDCGRISGLTDAHVPAMTIGEVSRAV
jgi:hypothetical protein